MCFDSLIDGSLNFTMNIRAYFTLFVGELSPLKRILKYGRHGQYIASSYYNPDRAIQQQKQISMKLLDLLSRMISARNKHGKNTTIPLSSASPSYMFKYNCSS